MEGRVSLEGLQGDEGRVRIETGAKQERQSEGGKVKR